MFTRAVDDDLYLELLHDGLAAELFMAVDDSRHHLRRWLDWVDDTRQVLDTREFLRLSMAGWAEGRLLRCAIRWRGRICGSIALEGINRRIDAAEVGYWLAQDCQGHGVMSRCVVAVTEIAFVELDLHRLEIRAAEENVRSWAIPERLGWVYEGVARSAGIVDRRRLDMRVYSRLRDD